MRLEQGDDPALGYCRICGIHTVPPYPGFYEDSVCSRKCFDEWKWRNWLHMLRKPYYLRGADAEAPTA